MTNLNNTFQDIQKVLSSLKDAIYIRKNYDNSLLDVHRRDLAMSIERSLMNSLQDLVTDASSEADKEEKSKIDTLQTKTDEKEVYKSDIYDLTKFTEMCYVYSQIIDFTDNYFERWTPSLRKEYRNFFKTIVDKINTLNQPTCSINGERYQPRTVWEYACGIVFYASIAFDSLDAACRSFWALMTNFHSEDFRFMSFHGDKCFPVGGTAGYQAFKNKVLNTIGPTYLEVFSFDAINIHGELLDDTKLDFLYYVSYHIVKSKEKICDDFIDWHFSILEDFKSSQKHYLENIYLHEGLKNDEK